MEIEELRKLAEEFFEWPTEDHNHVTLTSALLFAQHVLERRGVCEISNRICRDIPEKFHIELVLESGAGWVSLFHNCEPVDIDMADWNIAEQFEVAMQCVKEVMREQGDE